CRSAHSRPTDRAHWPVEWPRGRLSALVGPVAATPQIALEGLRDGIAGCVGGVPRVSRALQLTDVLGHVLVIRGSGIDGCLPRRRLGAQVLASRSHAGELLEPVQQ